MKRREFLLLIPGTIAFGQSLQIANKGAAKKSFITTATSVSFATSLAGGGTPLVWAWPDGTFTTGNSPTKSLAAGTKRLEVQSRDGFRSLVTFYCNGNSFSGTLPSFSTCTSLVNFYCYSNSFSGTLPSFSTCTLLVNFICYSNSFSGTLPSFSTCTSLVNFYCNGNSFSGTLPSFSTCTSLVNFYCGYYYGETNAFNNVVPGSFATQKSLSTAWFYGNAFPASAVNQVLADCVVSLGISGRVVCALNLAGGTNAAPTGQGIVDKATLVAAGWTVTTT